MSGEKESSCQFSELKSVKRLSKLPVVKEGVSGLNGFYEKAKENSVERIHGVLDVASSVVKGVALRVTSALGRPIKAVDAILDKSLCFVELKIPVVREQPNKLHEEIKNYVQTFWGGEIAYNVVERIAAMVRNIMEMIFISSINENVKLVRKVNSNAKSWVVKLVCSSVEVTLMTIQIIPEYVDKLFPKVEECKEHEKTNEESEDPHLMHNDQNRFIYHESLASMMGSKASDKQNNDATANHGTQKNQTSSSYE